MPIKWLKRIRNTGKLTFLNEATAWAGAINSAKNTFNNLHFNVKLEEVTEKKEANIVLILAYGAAHYNYYGDTVATKSDFKGDVLHGSTNSLVDAKRNEIFFSAIFLPAKVKDVTDKQKEAVVVHEFIHACGMASVKGSSEDHDSYGIMFDSMAKEGDGLIEYLHEKGTKSMPPIRCGSKTIGIMQELWSAKKPDK